jgi:hypothetical protein
MVAADSPAGEIACPAEQHSRNQNSGVSPDVGCLLFQDKLQTKGKRHERFYREV